MILLCNFFFFVLWWNFQMIWLLRRQRGLKSVINLAYRIMNWKLNKNRLFLQLSLNFFNSVISCGDTSDKRDAMWLCNIKIAVSIIRIQTEWHTKNPLSLLILNFLSIHSLNSWNCSDNLHSRDTFHTHTKRKEKCRSCCLRIPRGVIILQHLRAS